MDYWKECVSIAFEKAKIIATDEQIEKVAGAVESGHENYGMVYGYDATRRPVQSQAERDLEDLRREIKRREEWELSTRNHIAIEAMKGILASHAHPQSFGTPSTEEEIRKLTSDSYTIADAMIETSNKETTP